MATCINLSILSCNFVQLQCVTALSDRLVLLTVNALNPERDIDMHLGSSDNRVMSHYRVHSHESKIVFEVLLRLRIVGYCQNL